MAKRKTNTVGDIQEAFFLSGLAHKLKGPQLRIASASYFIKKRQLDSAELCLDLAIEEAASASDMDVVSLKRTLVEKALIAQIRKDFDLAERYLDRADALSAPEAVQGFEVGLVYNARGAIALAQHDYGLARRMYEKAAQAFSTNNEDMAASANLVGGFAAYREFNFEKSLELYRRVKGSSDALVEVRGRLGAIDALTALDRAEEAIAAGKSLEADIAKFSLRHPVRQSVLAALHEKEAVNWLSVGRTQRAIKTYHELSGRVPMLARTKIFATLSVIEFSRGRPDRAREYEKEARAFLSEVESGISDVLLSLSRLNLMRGHVDAASQLLFDATVELPKTVRKHYDTLAYELMDTNIAQIKGELTLAEDKAEELRSFLEDTMPFSTSHASILSNLAGLAQLNGDLERADDLYSQALSIGEQLGAPGTILRALSGLGQVALERTEADRAVQYFREARQIAERIEQPIPAHSQRISEVMAEAQMRGDPDEDDAEKLSDLLEQGFRFESVAVDLQAMLSLARVWSGLGDFDRAASYYAGAADDTQRYGMTLAELIAKGLLGVTLHNRGDTARAEEILTDVLARMASLGMQIPAKDAFEERYHDITGFWF